MNRLYGRNTILLLACIFFSLLTHSYKAQVSITYQEDTSDFVNPERGFYHQWLSDSKSPSALTQGNFDKLKADKMTLIRRLYSMTTFRSGAISGSYLTHIQSDMDNVRKNGVKIVLRFAYTFNESAPWDDAPLSTVLSHIDQLAPILQKNADVIAYMEAGFIGRWGEWHTSSNKLDNTNDMKSILFKLLTALPKSRSVAVRYQQAKKNIFNTTQSLTPAEGFNQTDRARTAHHNDCLVAAIDDWGTYWPTDQASLNAQKDYLNNENRFLPQGGETCNLNPPRSDCTESLADLKRMRWSALNDDYHPDVLNSWKNQGCFNEVRKKLGYRLRLIQASIPASVYSGTTLSFTFTIKNDGYAALYNTRDLEVVLRAKSGGIVTRFKLNDDPRKWLPENGNITVNVSIAIPSAFPTGDYDVLLNLPDPETALNTKSAYSIRLANKNVWETTTGYNSLLHKITILPSSTDITEKDSKTIIHIYPNPAKEEVTVSYFSSIAEKTEITITDILSRAVRKQMVQLQTGINEIKVNMRDLEKGLYIIQLIFPNKETITRNLLIN